MMNLPVHLGGGQVSVLQRGRRAVVKTNFGLIVSYDWKWSLFIKLPCSYFDSVCGLCGNFNDNIDDDRLNPAGQAVASVVEWAKSWKTPDQDKDCSDTCEPNCPICDDGQRTQYETEAFCGALTATTNNVFQQCVSELDPQEFFDDCVYDACYTQGDKKVVCEALASYSEQCQELGIMIGNWRRRIGCREYFIATHSLCQRFEMN